MKLLTFDVYGNEEVYLKTYRAIFGETEGKSVIDLCCGESHFLRRMGFAKRVYVDLVDRGLNDPVEQQLFVQTDVLGDHPVLQEHYDFATCMDGIEHLTTENGWKLLDKMKGMSDKSVLFTPADPWCMNPEMDCPESHKSLWRPEHLGEDYASVLFPQYHQLLTTDAGVPMVGAFFFWTCPNIEEDFERVKSLLSF